MDSKNEEKCFMNSNMISNVWKNDLKKAQDEFVYLLKYYSSVTIEVKFPGIVTQDVGVFSDWLDHVYAEIRANVNKLNPIQIGITFSDHNGRTPFDGFTSYQFNIRFDLKKDRYQHDSIGKLKRLGIDFKKLAEDGIEVQDLSEFFKASGMLHRPDIHFIVFRGGYSCAYFLKILTQRPLPEDRKEFCRLMNSYILNIWDLKCVMNSLGIHDSLGKLAQKLSVTREDDSYQAGSNTLLVCQTFFKLREKHPRGIKKDAFNGLVWGIGEPYSTMPPAPVVRNTAPNQRSSVCPVPETLYTSPPPYFFPPPNADNTLNFQNFPNASGVFMPFNSPFTGNFFHSGVPATPPMWPQPQSFRTYANVVSMPQHNHNCPFVVAFPQHQPANFHLPSTVQSFGAPSHFSYFSQQSCPPAYAQPRPHMIPVPNQQQQTPRNNTFETEVPETDKNYHSNSQKRM